MIKFLLLLFIFASHAHSFYGHKMKSYTAEMDSFFYVKNEPLGNVESLIRLHSSFMIGSLYGTRGTISHDFEISEIEVTQGFAGGYKVQYHAKLTMLLEDGKNLLNFSVSLPLYPEETMKSADTNCVGNYWYSGAEFVYNQFWSPLEDDCEMIPGKDFTDYPVTLTQRDSNLESYPRYEEMIKDGEVSLYYYFGSDFQNMSKFGESGLAFDQVKFWLRKKKFSFLADESFKPTSSAFVRAEKVVGKTKIVIKLMLGNPLPNTPTAQKEYFWFMKEAFEKGSFVQYTGHAGHGGIMDLTELEAKFQSQVLFPQDKFQIYYLNGCQTYIYATNYFPRKKGGYSNLHLLSNGDVSWGDTSWTSLEVFLNHFHDHFSQGRRMSYQEMIDTSSENMGRILGRKRNTPMLSIEGNL